MSFNSPCSFQIILYHIHSTNHIPWATRKPRGRCLHLDWIYLFNNESCDSFLMGPRVRLCINNKDVRIWPICDPKLVAIQNIVVACRKIRKKRSGPKTELYCRIKILKHSSGSISISKYWMSTHLQMLFIGSKREGVRADLWLWLFNSNFLMGNHIFKQLNYKLLHPGNTSVSLVKQV